MQKKIYNNYEKLSDIFECYAVYDFDQQLIDFLIGECANFLHAKGIPQNIIKFFSIEFEVSMDQSFVGIKGGNLMASLWLIDIYPSSPEKYIVENTCIFDKKKYIYDPTTKSIKIRTHGEKAVTNHR